MNWSPHHRGVEGAAPRVGSIDDGLFLAEACEVLATDIDGEMTEPAGDLCRHLLVTMEVLVPKPIDRGRHASATVQLQRGIKLPDVEGRLVTGCDEALIATGQRFLHEFATIGGLHVVPTPCGCQVQAFDDGVGGIYLEGGGIGLAVEVGDANLCRGAVVVDDGLLVEMRMIELGIQLERIAEQGDIERAADA